MSLSPSQVYHRVAVRSFTQSNPSSSTMCDNAAIPQARVQSLLPIRRRECGLGVFCGSFSAAAELGIGSQPTGLAMGQVYTSHWVAASFTRYTGNK